MGTRAVVRGVVGERVAHEVRRLRQSQAMTLRDLSSAMAQHGRPLIVTGVSKIEEGDRRVDVDDLVALALALGTTPHALLGWP